jgi:hypothetical protein
MDSWKEIDDIFFEITCLEIKYYSLRKKNKALITFPQYAAYRNPHWSKEDILHGIIVAEEKREQQGDGWKNRGTPHPLGACNFATVARCLGNQIIGVGVRIKSTLLRHTMTMMMRCVRMEQ